MERYDILGKLSEGGMGEVLLARATGEHGFKKLVAVKRIRAELSADPEFLLRFVTEAKVTVALSHANIVQVFDLARAGPDLQLVMEYVRGADLEQLLRRGEELGDPVSVPVLLYIAAEALKGLAYAHSQSQARATGIIHCDISPSNLLLSYAGEVKLVDFGIAQVVARRQTTDGRVLGKRKYMPPEQLAGQPLDARADLFSLAMVLKAALQRDGGKPRNPPPPAELTALLEQASHSEPRRRPASAVDFLRAVSEISRQLEPMVTAPEVGAWVARLVPPRKEEDSVGFGHAVADLLGAAPRVATRSLEVPTVTFVTRRVQDGTTVWEPMTAKPAGRARLAIALGALVMAVVVAGGLAMLPRGAAEPAPRPSVPKVVAAPEPAPEPAPQPAAPTEPAEPVAAPAAAKDPSKPHRPTPARGSGLLNVFAEPWATVVMDGRRIGTTPLSGVSVSAGVHRLRLEHPKRQPVEKTITISPGRTELVTVELAPMADR